MCIRARLLYALMGAAIALAVVVAPVGASAFEISPAGEIAHSGRVTFTPAEGAAFGCSVLLRGSLSRGPIEEARGARFGSITSGNVSACAETNTVTFLGSEGYYFETILIRFVVVGRLYVIRDYEVLWSHSEILGTQACLYRGNVSILVVVTETRMREGRILESTLTLVNDSLNRSLRACPRTMRVGGVFSPWEPAQRLIHI